MILYDIRHADFLSRIRVVRDALTHNLILMKETALVEYLVHKYIPP